MPHTTPQGWVDDPAYASISFFWGGEYLGGALWGKSDADARECLIWRVVVRMHATAMRTYLRNRVPGGTYFFTVNLAERKGNTLLIDHMDALRHAVRATRAARPFEIIAMVVLPEHLHAIWRLPEGDDDYSTRWRLLKGRFSHAVCGDERRSPSRIRKSERGIWQRRYWEHTIRDEHDLRMHIDHTHYNPVRHGLCDTPLHWPHSTFHRYARKGWLPEDWAGHSLDQ